MIRPQPRPTLFPYTTLFRSRDARVGSSLRVDSARIAENPPTASEVMTASLPPANITSASSYRMIFAASPIECAPVAQAVARSEEHTSELQSRLHLVCRLLLE